MIGFCLLALVALAMAIISCLPGASGVYSSLPMVMLWGAIFLASMWYILQKRLFRRPAAFMLHLSFGVILIGAFITHIFGSSDTLRIRIGEKAEIGEMTVELLDFKVVNYAGTQAPADFVSTLAVNGDTAIVAMNRVYTRDGYRIFQSAYDADRLGSILTVSHDPVGVAITYVGYATLLFSMIACLIPKLNRKLIMVVMLLLASVNVSAAPTLPRDLADEFGSLFIYHNGRIMPLSTLARDFSVKITGTDSYDGMTSEQLMTAWLFYYDDWRSEKCIKIKDTSTRIQAGVEGKYMSLKDFFDAQGQYRFEDNRHTEANEKFGLVSTAAAGSLWRIFPYGTSDDMQWLSPVDTQPAEMSVEQWHFTAHCINYLAELVANRQWNEAKEVVRKIAQYQQNVAAGALPSPMRVDCERLFVKTAPSIWPALLLLLGGLLLFIFPNRQISALLAVVGTLWVSFLIVLAWIASQHVPMSNGYETMLWMALSATSFGVCCIRRNPLAVPLCAVVAGLALMVAKMGYSNPQVSQVVPVLRSPLLSIHVLTVMLAYAALTIMTLCGIAYICGRRGLLPLSRRMLKPAVFLLAAGIFIGAVWANMSWGRYWGWDPKEVWALITMIIYSFPLHRASLPVFNRDRVFAIYTIVALLSVAMTYFGVNYILGGLHAYA